jgi:hypothetical protein
MPKERKIAKKNPTKSSGVFLIFHPRISPMTAVIKKSYGYDRNSSASFLS